MKTKYNIALFVCALTLFSGATTDASSEYTGSEISGTFGGGSLSVVVGKPSASPAAGTYTAAQNVSLLASDGTSSIHYTTDGTIPTCESGLIYGEEQISVIGSQTIKAISCYGGGISSDVAAFAYTINYPSRGGGMGSYPNPKLVVQEGEVLGVATSTGGNANACLPYLTQFLAFGRKNPVADVMKLQQFLNREMNAGLPITGYFGPLTRMWVKRFQVKYHDQILGKFDTSGGTGNVFNMTIAQINMIECARGNASASTISQ